MTPGLAISLLVNLAVGSYFLFGYRRTVQRSFRDRPLPPAFALLVKVVPPLGAILMACTLLYGLLVLAGISA